MVSREYAGLAGAGGVKDVCRQLAESLAAHAGAQVRVILPRYGFMDPEGLGFQPLILPGDLLDGKGQRLCPDAWHNSFAVDMNYPLSDRRETVSLWQRQENGVTLLLVEATRFREKLGVYTYTAEEEEHAAWQRRGSGHYDYFAMNILLQKAALDLMILLNERPDIIHAQDGHAATLAAMARENPGWRHYFRHSGLVVTIHNAGRGYHQEVADLAFAAAVTGLSSQLVQASLLEGAFDPFLAASRYAVLNTVSENYARELQETDEDSRTGWLGHSLLTRGVRLMGITNGIVPEDFDPLRPETLGLAAAFAPRTGDLAGKARCRESLLASLSPDAQHEHVRQHGHCALAAGAPLCTFIGRLTAQKGVDVLLSALPRILADNPDSGFLLLGSGDKAYEDELALLATSPALAGRLCFLAGYDEALALQVYAAGDFFLVPSLYEPCGLTDFIAQLLGNLPVVRHVGGLVKVLDGINGFAYEEHTAAALADTVDRALRLWQDDPAALRRMQQEAVRRIDERHSWRQVMRAYLDLYRQARLLACRN
ncbi:MAG: glycogen synthase [Desulfobulbaceae bacterium A2]|nr:MAG: glycogen synthase [Desulfobulbaceae bacterium A2]